MSEPIQFWALWWDNRGVETNYYCGTRESGYDWLRGQSEALVGWVIRESWSHGWKAIASGDRKTLERR